ncbi:TPA: 4-hydroxybenzoate octaprenyltransferase [Stenotrophomonas maltophilia]|uniref:4-hydroxybenzoate octaprenyltransferase n=1 Tax=Stenotrophomonas forensis TaxID=2871169 RepID=UPI0038CA2B05
MIISTKLSHYIRLTRLDNPIGSLLLLWPTLTGLWIASRGSPSLAMIAIFCTGVVLMRSAGCAMNDYADRDIDRHVQRTAHRPVTSGAISGREALIVAFGLALASIPLLVPLNDLARALALPSVALAFSYPWTKRVIAVPQAYLGFAFSFGILMAFAAVNDSIPTIATLLMIANIFWAVAYDTAYAMVDRDDDVKVGIRTSAITFGSYDVLAITLCYVATLAIYAWIGRVLNLGAVFWLLWSVAVALAAWYHSRLRTRNRHHCFAVFLHNKWFGGVLFFAIALGYSLQN